MRIVRIEVVDHDPKRGRWEDVDVQEVYNDKSHEASERLARYLVDLADRVITGNNRETHQPKVEALVDYLRGSDICPYCCSHRLSRYHDRAAHQCLDCLAEWVDCTAVTSVHLVRPPKRKKSKVRK